MGRGRRTRDVVTGRNTTDRFEARPRYYAPREAVWQVLCSPHTVGQIWPEYVHNAVVPGTGPGPGEVHVHVRDDAEGGFTVSGSVVRELRYPEFIRYEGNGNGRRGFRFRTEITFTDGPGYTSVHWVRWVTWPEGLTEHEVQLGSDGLRNLIRVYLRGSGRILGAPIDLEGVWRMT